MLVGEQPGDLEDREGLPFVGPAGQLLRRALDEAGVDSTRVYVTNAVKHFKWVERGTRRIHERANREEQLACRFWLEQELALVKPALVVALGATAAQALVGPSARVMRDRGRVSGSLFGPYVLVTVHPSSILRVRESAGRDTAYRQLVADLKKVPKLSKD
jgi:DNA polymerase